MGTVLSPEALRSAVDNMIEAVVIFDSEYTVVYQNPAALSLNRIPTGTPSAELERMIERHSPNGELLPVEDAPVARALRGETVRNEEVHIFRKATGEWRVWIYSAVPLWEERRVTGVVLNVRDVTEQKRKDRELERMARALKASNEDLERFASTAAHDLQEPLRIIGTFGRLLATRNAGMLDEESLRFLRYILNGVDQMQTLIANLMDFSRVNSAEVRLLARTDCSAALGAALNHLQFKIEESAAKISFDSLPVVMGNETLLVQVFENLISNAIKFCEGTPRLHISVKREENEWLFSIQDNGIGIPAEYRERIFGVFQRLHGRRSYPGSGMGLAICKQIIERHGGRIWAEPGPASGSTFYFTLPATAPSTVGQD